MSAHDDDDLAIPLSGAAPHEQDGDDEPVEERPRLVTPQAAVKLHPEPPPVMRLSRKAVAMLTALACLGGGGALVYGLRTGQSGGPRELYNTNTHAPAESVARAAKGYNQLPPGTPVLGAKMPGDLGRAIVANEQGNGGQSPATIAATAEAQRIEAARARVAQEHDAARSSRLFFGGAGGTSEGTTPPSVAGAEPSLLPAAAKTASNATPAEDSAQNGQSTKRAFLEKAANRTTLASGHLAAPADPNVVQAGTIIPAALITGIRSDVPGQITAQVTENVYDSPTGRLLLIPQGARLIGTYDSEISFGQNRVLLAWDRLILPGGRSIVLNRQPAGDAAGFAGLQDGVNQHWGNIVKAAMISTVLGVGTELASGSSSDALTSALKRGAQDSINQSGQQIVRRQLNIQPTLTVRPGFPLRVIVTRDLVLEPIGDTR